MKLYAPEYYKKFTCIADKCTHSCCIGWEIDVDPEALGKYRALEHEYANKLISSIDFSETPHFRLCENERCPHLNGNGLCGIILNLGEGYLCDICREHPRFYNCSPKGLEVGLGMACEEACRLILTSDCYCALAELDHESEEEIAYHRFDTFSLRERIYAVLANRNEPYQKRLERIYDDFSVNPADISDESWGNLISSLEYLDESDKTLFSCYSSELSTPPEHEKFLERALAYFVFRHCTEAEDEYDYCASLGFCLFCERLLASVLKTQGAGELSQIIRFARIVSEELEYSEDNTESIKDVFYY